MSLKTGKKGSRAYHRYDAERRFRNARRKKPVRMLRVLLAVVGIIGTILLLAYVVKQERETAVFSLEYVDAQEIPVFMQFTYYSEEEWEEKLGSQFTGRLTYQDVAELLDILHIKKYVTYEEKNPQSAVKREVWNQIYAQILDLLDTTGAVKQESVLVVEQEVGEADSQIICQKSEQLHFSLTFELAQYNTYQMYLLEDEVLGVAGKTEDEIAIPNVFVTSAGEELAFLYANGTYSVSAETEDKIENTVCDLYFKSGKLTRIQKKEDAIEGKLLALEDDRIEIEGYGVIERAESLPVYQTYGTIVEKSLSDIVLGNMELTYIVADKCVSAILLKEAPEIETVRVLLLNDDQSPYRGEVYIGSESAYQITCGTVSEQKEAGSVIKASDYLEKQPEESIRLEAADSGKLYFCDANGQKTSLPYDGSLEIRKYEQGYAVVNALSLEAYLYGVVPSEMPVSYPEEALKAQAVCARSYAYIQTLNGAYASLGAHIDDSTNYQVYNKQESDEATKKAVDDTCGQVISYQGQVVEAYYYSTSYGHTGTYQSWNLSDDGSFDYLSGSWLKESAEETDLSDEGQFAAYIKAQDDTCYDSFAKYFRWTAELTITDVSAAVRDAINVRKSAKPESIKICVQGQSEEVETAAQLGDVTSFSVAERNDCGGIADLQICFANGTADICDEYSIRSVLGAMLQKVTWNDGSEADIQILPSSYFTIEDAGNGSFTLYGGGYGHGIGMSQNGAKGMADAGMSYQDILKYFYQDIALEDCYSKE